MVEAKIMNLLPEGERMLNENIKKYPYEYRGLTASREGYWTMYVRELVKFFHTMKRGKNTNYLKRFNGKVKYLLTISS